jgi:UrcA family protein
MTVFIKVPVQYEEIVLHCIWKRNARSTRMTFVQTQESDMRKGHEADKWIIGYGKPRRRDRQPFWVVLACLMAGIGSQCFAAAARSETTDIQLRYKHQELTSASSARVLLKRIGDAALESCGASPFSLAEFKAATKVTQCWRDAVDEAVRRIGSPVLNAVASEARR